MELTSRKVLRGFMLVFLVLYGCLGYWVVVRGPALNAHTRNPRLLAAEARIARGAINDRYGEPLAVSVWEKNGYRRQYLGPLSAVQTVGYAHTRFGKSGLERAYDSQLRGGESRPRGLLTGLSAGNDGLDITTTLDTGLQRAAEKALGKRKGAIVALDADTGAILVAASAPFFDPGQMEESLFSGPEGGPLFNRALQGRYPPGSSWKPLVLAAALESKSVSPQQVFDDPPSIEFDGYEIGNYGGASRGQLGLTDALAFSSNTVFVQIGLATGLEPVVQLARKIGLLDAPQLGSPAVAGHLPAMDGARRRALAAEVSIGQGETWMSPLQMAMVAATIANGGYAVRPYLVQAVGGLDVRPVQARSRVISDSAVSLVRSAMRAVVTYGTGTRAAVSGMAVSGKTGTADNPSGNPHAWFIGFGRSAETTVAVAVILENAGTGGTQSAPLAAEVFKAFLASGSKAKRGESAAPKREAESR